MNDLLAKQEFGLLCSTTHLYRYFDSDRLPEVVDWARAKGVEEGHVPILYMHLRNLLKHNTGTVMCKEQFDDALFCVVNLLLRTAQDVVCCKRLYAARGVEECYTNLRAKIQMWLEKFRGRQWTSLSKIISSHALTATVAPSPVWCTACSVSFLSSSTIYFGKPSDELCESAIETSAHVQDIRQKVARNFLAWARGRLWGEFLAQDYKDREYE